MSPSEELIRKILGDTLIYVWVIVLSFLGFLVRIMQEISKGRKFSLFGIITEFAVSAFSGIVMYFITSSLSIDVYIQSAAIAISGHMGGNVIQIVEEILVKSIRK